jgi:hypothetical protein
MERHVQSHSRQDLLGLQLAWEAKERVVRRTERKIGNYGVDRQTARSPEDV